MKLFIVLTIILAGALSLAFYMLLKAAAKDDKRNEELMRRHNTH